MLYLVFRKLKKYKNVYLLFILNRKRKVLKKMGMLSFMNKDLDMFLLHLNFFVFKKLCMNGMYFSEDFYKFLYMNMNKF